MVDEDINDLNEMADLKREFLKIKKMGAVKSLRSGTTGSGYTFETLLGKKEDQESKPDYKGIEIKCKYAFSETHLGLFTCAPKRDGGQAYNYIYENYSFEKLNFPDEKIFSLKFFSKYTINKEGFEFKLFVDRESENLILKSYFNNEFLEDVCYWSFESLKDKLYNKIQKLAIVDCYPYRRIDGVYYKYTNIAFYKLKSFETFLELIQKDVICISTYLKPSVDSFGKPIIDCHGFHFQIRKENIDKLFNRIIV